VAAGSNLAGPRPQVAVRLRVDRGAVRNLFTRLDGPVGRDLSRRALRVEARAKTLAPVDTGRLRSSIRWNLQRRPSGVVATVGTDVEYGLAVHEGARGRRPRPFLRDALPAARD
jgi:hypothetical protein